MAEIVNIIVNIIVNFGICALYIYAVLCIYRTHHETKIMLEKFSGMLGAIRDAVERIAEDN
jgi:hypothetical protein